jgi:hypothetical protein
MQVDARLRELRGQLKDLQNQFDKSENDLKVIPLMLVCLSVSVAFLSTLNPGIIETDPYFKKYSQTCDLASFFAGSHGFPMLQMGSCYIFILNRSGIIRNNNFFTI